MNKKLKIIFGFVVIIFFIFFFSQSFVSKEKTKIRISVIEDDITVDFSNWSESDWERAWESGEYVGCGDKLSYIEKEISYTTMPLTAIYEELFKMDGLLLIEEKRYRNPIYDQDNMQFEKVEIEGEVANIYLLGEYVSIGTCEPPRTEAVLKFAALQYPWISDVKIYLNGKEIEFIHGGK